MKFTLVHLFLPDFALTQGEERQRECNRRAACRKMRQNTLRNSTMKVRPTASR